MVLGRWPRWIAPRWARPAATCSTSASGSAREGKRAWIVGGCVRDLLLGRAAADWDVATDARPSELLAIFPRAIPTGIEHGTVTVVAATGSTTR